MSKITTYKLPRKLKVSYSSSEKDYGNSTVADLGFLAIKKDNKEKEVQRKEGELKETYTNSYGSVKIKNDTDIKLTKEILKPDYNVKNSKDILIYHTHTCESYTKTEENSYKATGNFRTTDLNYSISRAGNLSKANTFIPKPRQISINTLPWLGRSLIKCEV